MEQVVSSASSKALLISKDIVKLYYNCVHQASLGEYEAMKQFQREYPSVYKRFNAIHRKRTRIKHSISAMKVVAPKVYFGCLTFNEEKDANKISTKRREAFKDLNSIFEYVLLIEELGSKKERYHVHFLATFKEGKNFQDFRRIWHSRQNLRELQENENVSQYMCKYLSKDLPRIRCNKALVRLEKAYKLGLLMERDHFDSLGTEFQCKKIHFVNAFDLLE